MKYFLLLTLMFVLTAITQAQSATLAWTAPDNTLTAVEASTLTYTLYVNNGVVPGISVAGVACTGATAPFNCTAPVPAGVPTSIGTKLELTAKSATSGEGPRSVPFISAPTAPTNFRRQ